MVLWLFTLLSAYSSACSSNLFSVWYQIIAQRIANNAAPGKFVLPEIKMPTAKKSRCDTITLGVCHRAQCPASCKASHSSSPLFKFLAAPFVKTNNGFNGREGE